MYAQFDLPRDGGPAARLSDARRLAERRAHSGQRRLAYVPEGFAHGYQTLDDDTEVLYQMSHPYVPEAASGVRWDDPAFGIEWPATDGEHIISKRDLAWPDYAV